MDDESLPKSKREDVWTAEKWIANFFVNPIDPGFIYIIENEGLYKIGRSNSRTKRLREAKTWLPNMRIVGVKPFWDVAEKEKLLHVAFAFGWHAGEWFRSLDEGYKQILEDDFKAFSDNDINKNSVDFIYWYNSSGMVELVMEQNYQRKSIRKFLRDESLITESG